MKTSLSWLKEYVDIDLPPQELAHRLTMVGVEEGYVQTIGGEWDNIGVAQVVSLDPHPNADRLQLVTVDLGDETTTVVAGAFNIKVGDKVPFARVGATVFDGHTGEVARVKAAKIRGVESRGMCCSEKELGLSGDHSGILVLPPDAPLGTPLADYLADSLFEFDITPNRPDCLSVVGIAREIAAFTGKPVREPDATYREEGPPIAGLAAVEIADSDLCPRYCASLVSGITIGPSPRWMQDRLLAAGMRPINNVVDITNYVMLELGQPLHAFDYEMLGGHKIIVRRARQGEKVVSIDEVERPLEQDMLVIADAERAIAIAGVMGGAESEVTGGTTAVLLESANFNNVSIRRTSARLRLRTEASARFDKGLSRELPRIALRRATKLFVELCGGKAAQGVIDIYPGKQTPAPIILTARRIKQVLGVEWPLERAASVLGSLGFQSRHTAAGSLGVSVPYWRTDTSLADDLIEELARISGYDEIPSTTLSGSSPPAQPDPLRSLREQVRDLMVGLGFQEVIGYSLTSAAVLEKVAADNISPNPVRLANPMSSEQEYLRTTIRGSLLATLASNQRHDDGSIRLFEVGRIYLPRDGDLPEEREMLGIVLSGPRSELSWAGQPENMDFFDAKGVLESLLAHLGATARFQPFEDPILLPGRTARIMVNDVAIGVLGEVHPNVAASFDLAPQPVFLLEIDLQKLLPFTQSMSTYRPLPRFPSVIQDLALVVDEAVPAQAVHDIIEGAPLVSQATLFDVYRGGQLPPGKKSLAFRVVYQSPERTLTDEEVGEAQRAILRQLGDRVGARLRG